MDEWTENSQDINIFSDYDIDSEDEKFHRKRKSPATNEIIIINTEDPLCKEESSYASKKHKQNTRISDSLAATTDSMWSIEDDTLFYPLGICNHCIAGANKSVIITWSQSSVINFVIKKMVNKKQTKTTRVRLNVRENEIIKDVIILEYNTLLLLESGNVNYFSSAKSMHPMPWLKLVRCMARSLDGFCIIRLTTEQRLLLEVYEDMINMGKKSAGSVKQSYDITFDEQNLFNCSWEDESFIISAVPIENGNVEFMEKLIGNSSDLYDQKEIFIFAVSGNVFVLIPDASNNESFHIEPIFSYASNVQFIRVDHDRKFCLIFLTCGTLDIWYMSNLYSLLHHYQHHTGASWVNFTYSDSRASLFFTDESQVVQVTFHYNSSKDIFCVKETVKAISGIIVTTWIETIEQLVCLDCNNIFHQLIFETVNFDDDDPDTYRTDRKLIPSSSTVDYEKFNSLFELTPARVAQLTEKGNFMRQLNNLPKDLYDSIENEYVKQELLAIENKRIYYSRQFKAFIKFSEEFHIDTEADALVLYANKNELFSGNNVFVHISLKIACNEIFQNSKWQLHVAWDDSVQIFVLPCRFFESKIHLVVPIRKSSQKLLADIQLVAYTFISHASEHIAISFPIQLIESSATYAGLFSTFLGYHRKALNFNNFENIFLKFKTESAGTTPFEFRHILRLPKKFKFETSSKLFREILECETSAQDKTCTFLNHHVTVNCEATKDANFLNIKSQNAAALYYLKLCIILAIHEKTLSGGLFHSENYQQMLLRHQSSVERCYGTLAECDILETNSSSIQKNRTENLRKIYEKIRRCLITK